MVRLRKLSGRELIKILSKAGFKPKRRKGSHIILIKESEQGRIGCVVPLHKELKIGTLRSILKQAKLSEDDFMKLMK